MVVVAEGVDNIKVEADIISAAEAVTGLGKHKIKVYEMKEEESGKEAEYGEG